MKRIVFSIVMVAGLLVFASAALAQIGTDTVVHNTAWSFQNLGDSPASVHVDLYDTTGALIATDDFTVDPSAAFWAPSYGPLDGHEPFDGGLVASSSQPLASIANQVAQNNTSGKLGNATYMGFTADTVGTTMYLPAMMKSFAGIYWTEISVQSTGGDLNVDVHYYNPDGTEVVGSPSNYAVPAGSPIRIAQEDETILPAGWIGSATVVSDGDPVAVVVNEFYGTSGNMYNQFYSYEGFAEGAYTVIIPAAFINGYDGTYNASFSVQNLNGAGDPANVHYWFYEQANGLLAYDFAYTVATADARWLPTESYAQTLMDFYAPGDNSWVGSIVITSDNPIVGMANELAGGYWAASYVGIMDGSDMVCFPVALADAYGLPANTAFSVVDVNNTGNPINIVVHYYADTVACPLCSDANVPETFTTVGSYYQPNHIPAGAMQGTTYIGSVCVEATTAGAVINGVMNEVLGGASQDNFTAFNGFAQ